MTLAGSDLECRIQCLVPTAYPALAWLQKPIIWTKNVMRCPKSLMISACRWLHTALDAVSSLIVLIAGLLTTYVSTVMSPVARPFPDCGLNWF